jgi:aldehyde dehydrogenase (NAD+)
MHDVLSRLGLSDTNPGAWTSAVPLPMHGEREILGSENPATGDTLARIALATKADLDAVIEASERAFVEWRKLPAPRRGEIVRQMAEALRAAKMDLGKLVTLEVGKIASEGQGEVQESIDIADFAVGLSRQLYGLSMHSERARHRMYEQWHPLGPVAVITAFNFPNAVWAWNAMLALVCGDTVIWKPSLKASLTAIATHRICAEVLAKNGWEGVLGLVIGSDAEVGESLVADRRIPLVSATGSVRMGRRIGQVVSARLGRSLLELGGNNAIVVDATADLDLALRGILFGAVGTAGQRCTSTRRLFLHESVADAFTRRLVSAYEQVRIGDPMEEGTLMGPLIDADAVQMYERAIAAIRDQGGEILTGGTVLDRPPHPNGHYVRPTVVRARPDMPICREETFAPILYVIPWREWDEVMAWHNDVPQGLSSALFTDSFRTAERFLSAEGSDCGIANVNIGTSGAEIGGAFGGEKETGGGREAGSDSWKNYMRRQTCTLNWSPDLPLAQGVRFDL